MIIDRFWAMPSKNTFSIKPIRELLYEEMRYGGLWLDPFSGGSKLATITNDLNPEIDADYRLESLDFLRLFSNSSADGVLFDPVYSLRQLKECYESVGLKVNEPTRSDWWTKRKRQIARIIRPGGKCISFGWNSNGIGKSLGFNIVRIVIVAHGGVHNDTICTVEIKGEIRYEKRIEL